MEFLFGPILTSSVPSMNPKPNRVCICARTRSLPSDSVCLANSIVSGESTCTPSLDPPVARAPYIFASDLAVPCPLAAGISAFLHRVEFASMSELSNEFFGLLNAAPDGFSGSVKSNRSWRELGSKNLGSFSKTGISNLCNKTGLFGCRSTTLENLSSGKPIQKSKPKGFANSSSKY